MATSRRTRRRPDPGADAGPRGRTLADFRDALRPREPGPGWLVRTRAGLQFQVHRLDDRAGADAAAARVGGTVEPYTPNPSTYWDRDTPGSRYDH